MSLIDQTVSSQTRSLWHQLEQANMRLLGVQKEARLLVLHLLVKQVERVAARTLGPCLWSALFQESGAFLLRRRGRCRHRHPVTTGAAATRTGTSNNEHAAKASSEQRTAESAQTGITLVDGLTAEYLFSRGDRLWQLDRHGGQPERRDFPGTSCPCSHSFLSWPDGWATLWSAVAQAWLDE